MINLNQNTDPSNNIVDLEQKNNFLKFCTLVCIIHNKKLNLANIFLLILQEKQIKKLYMEMCDFDTEMEALKSFFDFDSTLHKSKYIKKYLNSINKAYKKNAKRRKRTL